MLRKDEGRVAGHIAVDADEDDDESHEGFRRAAEHFLHERGEESALFRAARADDADQHHGERREGGEIRYGLAPHLTESVEGEEIDDLDHFVRARMDGFHAHRAEEGRREHGEEREQDKEGNCRMTAYVHLLSSGKDPIKKAKNPGAPPPDLPPLDTYSFKK